MTECTLPLGIARFSRFARATARSSRASGGEVMVESEFDSPVSAVAKGTSKRSATC